MYVGASMVHSGDTFRMFDVNAKRIHLTRDVKMLQKEFYRQDGTVSSDQPHPLDTTFDNLTIFQEERVTGVVSADEVRVNHTAIPPDADDTSLVSSDSLDNDSDDSCEGMPPLERPILDTSTSGDSNENSSFDNWSESPDTTFDATLPDGVRLDPVTVREVDPPLVEDVVDATHLQPGDTVDLNPPIPTVINVTPSATSSLPEQTVTRTRSGRRIHTPSRYRDAGLITFDRPHSYSIFDIED